ncbi:HAD family hydrolase [Thalassobacillus hwangdonensis]|uniref:HAD family hydrolase n=1 Tax=Thalassobacillus hwangdonensis TaxID=546108 RepID=A0ABW3L0Z4_9BACI
MKAVLFDLDGTILDRDASLIGFLEEQHERFSFQVEKEVFVRRFVELDAHGYVGKDQVYETLVQEFVLGSVDALHTDYLERFKHHCVGFDGAEALLQGLKEAGVKLGVITNGRTPFQEDNLHGLGLSGYFDTIVVSEKEGLKKPDPAIFRVGLNRLGVAASESMYIGDHPEKDVQAAKAVGMKAMWKKSEVWDAPVDADGVIETWDDWWVERLLDVLR